MKREREMENVEMVLGVYNVLIIRFFKDKILENFF